MTKLTNADLKAMGIQPLLDTAEVASREAWEQAYARYDELWQFIKDTEQGDATPQDVIDLYKAWEEARHVAECVDSDIENAKEKLEDVEAQLRFDLGAYFAKVVE